MISKARILAVDDDKNLVELIRDTLEGEGYEVITAGNGREALEKLYSEKPDIMLLDVRMPHMSGYEVCEKVRNDILMRNLPIIMLTVKSTEREEVKGLKAGVDDYLTKPFSPPILLARIRSALDRVQQGINVNPLTYLPGNAVIIKEIEGILKKDKEFAVLFIDLDNFKSFNDYYGFQQGDEVIKETARIIVSIVSSHDEDSGFVGHIGGDDFTAIVAENKMKTICAEIIEKFDSKIISFYDREDVERDFIIIENRRGVKEKFPIMTISIGVVASSVKKISHVGEISKRGNELKKYAKKFEKSKYVIDRRKDR